MANSMADNVVIEKHHLNYTNMTLEELSEQELKRYEHLRQHEIHKGHDVMHAEMIIILFITLIGAQVILVEWKRRHHKSYQLVTLAGMWIIPLGLSLKNSWWRFIFLWLLFTCITALIVKKAVETPIEKTTPRLVYKWFYFIYKLSYALGLVGYCLMVIAVSGLNTIIGIKAETVMDFGVLCLFYGLYFGVLGQDIAEISSDKMASHIGYYSKEGIPSRSLDENVCAVCSNKLPHVVNDDENKEKTYRLSCDHVFHEFCIRGWCIVGKKQICPYCKEKVDLKQMFRNPWEKPHVLYGSLLVWIRWLIAWQPVILCIVRGINYVLALE